MQDFDTLSFADQLPILLEVARSAMAFYDHGSVASLALINLSENATYRVDTETGATFALRIHRDGYSSREEIDSELAWVLALRQQGQVVTPLPLPGRDGELIQTATHPRLPRPRHLVLFAWEHGREPGIAEDLAKPFEALGTAAAHMHLHVMKWQKPPRFTRRIWDVETALGEDAPHWGRWREGLGMTADMRAVFASTVDLISARLSAYGKSAERFGLVHGDMRLANLLVDGDTVKVIDFDDCGFSWFMYDAATTISFHEHEPQVPRLIESWKSGYRRVRELSAADEAEINTFIMLRRLLLVAWIGTRRDTDLAKSMGVTYSQGTVGLCETYLLKFG
jgi:Ser/Thr protein kinase RdoA (MazF antagonist)